MVDPRSSREWTQVLVSAVCDFCDGQMRIGQIGSLPGIRCPRCRGAGRVLRYEWRPRAELETLRKGEQR